MEELHKEVGLVEDLFVAQISFESRLADRSKLSWLTVIRNHHVRDLKSDSVVKCADAQDSVATSLLMLNLMSKPSSSVTRFSPS
jgi:hypothetical protein